ncbi:MAG: M20/M25/M40 family metallo-hydrolase [Oscillospiraceae bacterium]|jgi:carboxypeptidase PM20D1|nr:M20/M25/M40 family metallo-hydrolase [Oscillospiraceae bacterium]
MDTILWIVLGLLAVFLAVTAIRAAFFVPKKNNHAPLADESVDRERAARHLTGAIQIPTISYPEKDKVDWAAFERFHDYLRETYPLIHKHLTREVVAEAALLYCWKGKNAALKPIALLSHQDVVPISGGTEDDWTHPPFSGYNDGEYIWGRGAIDMKNHLICVMEAVETLLAEGFIPERDVYLCFGHDEEVVGAEDSGAYRLRKLLESRGITELESTLDEGGAMLPINTKVLGGVLAGIGISEKGYADFEITVLHKGGHSAQPPDHTALGELADVIKDIEKHQFKAKMLPFFSDILDAASRKLPYALRLIGCNHKLLKPLLTGVLTKIPPAASMLRTTTACTMAKGSPACNVLPQKASLVVNFRLMPGTTVADVEAHIRKVVRNKKIEIKILKQKEASPFSSINSTSADAIKQIVLHEHPDAIVAPYLVMGGTDSYFYEPICKHVYRFSPFLVDLSLLLCAHATNERIPIATLEEAVAFFKRYIRLAGK